MKGTLAIARACLCVAALLISGAASAELSIKEIRKQTEASMLVTGWVIIEADGAVGRLDIDQREKLPAAVAELIDKASGGWKFEPVVIDGHPRRGKARMSLRVVANRLEDGNYRVTLTGGHFGDEADPEKLRQRSDSVRSIQMTPPRFPENAVRMGARGSVYLVIKVERDGSVGEVLAEQVNLGTVGNERQMRQMRQMRKWLSEAALTAARRWRFQPPTEGDTANAPFWQVRVPVDFLFWGEQLPGYGEWRAYIPGPRQSAPWMEQDDACAPDALVAGEVYEVGKGRRLLTPLSG